MWINVTVHVYNNARVQHKPISNSQRPFKVSIGRVKIYKIWKKWTAEKSPLELIKKKPHKLSNFNLTGKT